MALQSQLFRGDSALEAAANVDSAHITPGARGPHVEKIQTALNILDSAGLEVDGRYGPATANAVLGYKTKRDIINRSYQTSADNIVGKMTIARLDKEMLAHEAKPKGRIQLIPISPRVQQEKAFPRVAFALTGTSLIAAPAAVLPTEAVTLDMGSTAEIAVKNGKGCLLTTHPAHVADLIDPATSSAGPSLLVGEDDLVVKVRGKNFGSAVLLARRQGSSNEQLVITVIDRRPQKFTPTKAHHHTPVSEPDGWLKICAEAAKDPDEHFFLKILARNDADPETVVKQAKSNPLSDLTGKSMAMEHFNFYLSGKGGTFNEDDNLKIWINRDSHAREVIARKVKEKRRPNEIDVNVQFEFGQLMFGDQDARFSFGTIDFLDVAADFARGKVTIWFEDTYEWHPKYKAYGCTDVKPRNTNFLHAALVQMKINKPGRNAADFQMRGNAEFPMKIFPGL